MADRIVENTISHFCEFLHFLDLLPFKGRSSDLVVFLAVGEGEGGGVAALDGAGAAGKGASVPLVVATEPTGRWPDS